MASTSSMQEKSGKVKRSTMRAKSAAGNRAKPRSAKPAGVSSQSSGRPAANDAVSSPQGQQAEESGRIIVTRLGERLNESRTDWARVDACTDAEIGQMAIEDGTADIDWTTTAVVMPPMRSKESIHLRIDRDILEWFRSQGPGHLTRINAVLRSYVEAQRK